MIKIKKNVTGYVLIILFMLAHQDEAMGAQNPSEASAVVGQGVTLLTDSVNEALQNEILAEVVKELSSDDNKAILDQIKEKNPDQYDNIKEAFERGDVTAWVYVQEYIGDLVPIFVKNVKTRVLNLASQSVSNADKSPQYKALFTLLGIFLKKTNTAADAKPKKIKKELCKLWLIAKAIAKITNVDLKSYFKNNLQINDPNVGSINFITNFLNLDDGALGTVTASLQQFIDQNYYYTPYAITALSGDNKFIVKIMQMINSNPEDLTVILRIGVDYLVLEMKNIVASHRGSARNTMRAFLARWFKCLASKSKKALISNGA